MLNAAWESSTWASYSSAVRSYFNSCTAHEISSPFPPSTPALMIWCLFLFYVTGLAASTINQYVTAVKSTCRMLDVSVTAFNSFQLKYTLRGMLKTCPHRFKSKPRLPITIWLLAAMFTLLSDDTRMTRVIKGALSLGLYALLRGSEFLAKGHNLCPLARGDVTWHKFHADIRLRFTKRDIFHTGITVKIFKNDSPTCPYTWLKTVVDEAPFKIDTAPVFQNNNGSALSYNQLQTVIKGLAINLGLDATRFKLHSLRIGGATSLAILGVPPHIIKAIGRWKSICYQIYTLTCDSDLQSVSDAFGRACLSAKEDYWFGVLPSNDRYSACSWAVDGLEAIALRYGRPDGILATVA